VAIEERSLVLRCEFIIVTIMYHFLISNAWYSLAIMWNVTYFIFLYFPTRGTRYVFGNTMIAFPLYCFPTFWKCFNNAALFRRLVSQKYCQILISKIQYLHSAKSCCLRGRRELRSSLTSPTQPRLNRGVTAGNPRFNLGQTAVDPRSNRGRPEVEPPSTRG
jgi:hypothetical protein